MIQKVEMYTVSCDHCQLDIGMDSEYSCWNDELSAEEQAMESEWHKEGSKHYCPDCYGWDDEDNFFLNQDRKDKNSV